MHLCRVMPSLCFVVPPLLASCYAAILRLYQHGWRTLPEWKLPEGFTPTLGVSILIPARNEAHNIGLCLQSILDNHYPPHLLEILVVDDHSTDETGAVVRQIQAALTQKGHPSLLRLLCLAEYGVEGKKMALTQAVRQATMPLVLTTDADCVVGRAWIWGWVAAFDPTPNSSPGGEGGLPTTIAWDGLESVRNGMGDKYGAQGLGDLPTTQVWDGLESVRNGMGGKSDARGGGNLPTTIAWDGSKDLAKVLGKNNDLKKTVSLLPDEDRSSPKPPSPPGEGLGVGSVLFLPNPSLLQQFQALDFIGLMGITGAGIHLGFQRMGNGANMAYRKTVFEAVGGYTGNENIASGDDLFLIQKVEKRFPGSVFFLKSRETAVWTAAEPNWRAFWRQRVRWGAKNAALPEWPVRLVLLAVFLFCWSIVLTGVWLAWALVFSARFPYGLLGLWLGQLAVKAWADWLFLREICRFFDRMELMRRFWPSFALHTLYIAVVGLAGLCYKKYEWKGRRTR